MASKRPIVAGLDIGTWRIAAVIAAASRSSLELLGAGYSLSVGISNGVINDPSNVARCIMQALEIAQKMAGVEANSAYVSYNGSGVNVREYSATFPARNIYNFSCEIDNTGICQDAKTAGIFEEEKVLQFISPRLVPESLGYGLEPSARAITVPVSDIQKIEESMYLAGLKVRDIIYTPLAEAQVVLNQAERELGTLLVDIGAGTTSVSIFDRGEIKETSIIPVGGEHLVADLAIGLRITLARAENILINYGISEAEKRASVYGIGGEEDKVLSHDLVKSIVEARVGEILDLVAAAVKNFKHTGLLLGGAVFCGGVSRLNGLAVLGQERLQLPVRVGLPEDTGFALDPTYTNALGLVKLGCDLLYRKRNGIVRVARKN